MSKLPSICLFCLLCLASACTNEDPIGIPDIVPTIEDEFNVQLWEHLSVNGNTLSLLVETIDNQECLNTEIISEISIQNSNLVVNLDGIELPDDCIEGEAPATADVSFANLSPGEYDLELNILEVIKNEGFIEVTPESLKMELTSDDGINITLANLNRIPNNTYWGYIALDNSELDGVTSEFLEQIELLKDDVNLVDGNYGHFNLLENKPQFEADTAFPDIDRFVFKLSGEQINLATLINNFRADHLDKLEIKVLTYQGMEL